ncbi:MAG TPA: hypothetical protein VJ831_00450, partial [Jatrophihabitantaceae bacterium]|nr:hypothetical protein [Jatrophihabitantaceae bacterium]
ATVPFKAVIHNLSAVPVRIDSLTDAVSGLPSLHNICGGLIGTTLAANGQTGDAQTCLWSEANYAPPSSAGAKVNIAAVTVSQVGDPTNTASDDDPSAVTSPTPSNGISVDLVKTNDADGDGNYHDAEVAPKEGADVPFRAVITNTSPVAVQLLTLTDENPDHAASPICSNLVNAPTVLQPGAQVTCNWIETDYAWAQNLGAKVDVARVTVGEVGRLSNVAGDNDSSAVTTQAPRISVSLVKTNDADRDATYHDAEVAPGEGADVAFQAVITNTSDVAVRIDAVTDLLPGHPSPHDICGNLLGTVLQPGESVTCTWVESGYAGAPDAGAKVDTASVTVSQVGHPAETATAQDTSAVTTATVPVISITVAKTNDANADGTFTDDETGTAGSTVAFRAVITNTSTVPVVIDSITDVWPGTAGVNECASLIGTTLQPGASVTCDFTVANYTPTAADGAKVNTITVNAHDASDPSNGASAADPSTVRGTEPVVVLGETIAPAPLPRTGVDVDTAVMIAIALVAFGWLLLLNRKILLSVTPRPIDRDVVHAVGTGSVQRIALEKSPRARHGPRR